MDSPNTTKTSIFRMFPGAFWSANAMEIFERMGWYGFYAVSTLYLTGAVGDGCLGFSSEERGVIQGIATFFLYLFPAFFGALADRFGYRAMFIASSMVMAPAYIILSIPKTFWWFLFAWGLVAVGHGMFKPVVISTVAKSTNEETGSMGFGIFYMMVNIGGWVGPSVAGIVRGWSWTYVFYASCGWVLIQGLIALLFYREPARDAVAEAQRSLLEVLAGMIKVVGNIRFFVLICVIMILLVLGSKWLAPLDAFAIAAVWLIVNLLVDVPLRRMKIEVRRWWDHFLQPMRVGETRYLIFLLLMSGFWTSFNQIFMTLPEYIRDYGNTADLVRAFGPAGTWIAGVFSNLGFDTTSWANSVLENGQVKPEHLINLNALGIIFFQILISYYSRKLKAFTTIISGVSITVFSFLVYMLGTGGWVIVSGILVFSVGEMLASPKSKEYAGRIAPPDKVGMYMGYFYWCVALGNLFGGLLSGVSYGYFGPKGIDNPDMMWVLFAGLALISAFLLAGYNRWVTQASPS